MVTQASIDAVEQQFSAARGRKSMHRIMVIEATGDENLASPTGGVPVPKLEMQPLAERRQGDALFQEYEKNNSDKVRSAFRLPPLFVGLSEDMTYSTAQTAYEVAETQVFAPERQRYDTLLNQRILSAYTPKFWAYRSNPPRMSSPDAVMGALEKFDAAGAMTPNIAIMLANQFFDLKIQPVEDEWGDFPFPIVMKLVEAGRIKFDGLENVEPPEPAQPAPPAPQPSEDPLTAPPAADAAPEDPAQAEKAEQEPMAEAARRALWALRDALLQGQKQKSAGLVRRRKVRSASQRKRV